MMQKKVQAKKESTFVQKRSHYF